MSLFIKKSTFQISILLLFIFLIACSKEDIGKEKKPSEITPPTSEYEVENFIYRGMSDVYLYKSDVPVLADNYFLSEDEKNDFYAGFSTPEKLMQRLMSPEDRFSYLVENYEEVDKIAIGSTTSTGMEYGLVSYCNGCQEVLGYVRYIIPGSSAEEEGIKRGMIFNRINGQQLTNSNFRSLLSNSTFTLGLALIEGSTVRNLETELTISTRNLSLNPLLTSKTIDINGTKIGYIFYNSFSTDFDEELNAAFGVFKADHVTELILDLRYNGGGSVRTATDLASMITGQFPGEVFMKEQWNDKYQEYYEQVDPQSLLNNFNKNLRTGTAIQSLNLSRVVVLTTKSTASASELIINGLDPYIDVLHIGDVTTGKFQASATIYDSPNFSNDNSELNISHAYALQPLVLKSINANGVTDYSNGLNPDILHIEDIQNLGIIGDPNEPLLKTALDVITGIKSAIPPATTYSIIGESGMFQPDYQVMYLEDISLPSFELP